MCPRRIEARRAPAPPDRMMDTQSYENFVRGVVPHVLVSLLFCNGSVQLPSKSPAVWLYDLFSRLK